MNLNLDLKSIPFSTRGSYLSFSYIDEERSAKLDIQPGLWLRSVHGDSAYECFHLDVYQNNAAISYTIETSPSTLSLICKNGRIDISYEHESSIRFKIKGVDLKFAAKTFRNHFVIQENKEQWLFNLAATFRSFRMTALNGKLTIDAPWETKRCKHMIAQTHNTEEQVTEIVIDELTWMRNPKKQCNLFENIQERNQNDFDNFSLPILKEGTPFYETLKTALYLNWSSIVHPHRLIKRPAMYMSKNWMTNVWSWDHAFNAIASSLHDSTVAWDQWMITFDHQDEEGQIPDFINDVRLLTNFVKPPIQGWALMRMIDFGFKLSDQQLEVSYDKLSRWTEWWFNYRCNNEDELPTYWHGNDSGWDNATSFDVALPLISADLSAYLILQMDALSYLAKKMNQNDKADYWKNKADNLLEKLIEKLWDGHRFKAKSSVTHEIAKDSNSAFNCLAILLGKKLPQNIFDTISQEIEMHLTQWGIATENTHSSLYEPDGYWRGPIWAPSTLIIIDGLKNGGNETLAKKIAERFCLLCEKSGFAENFNAITGDAQRDKAYTWTSSVFIVLCEKYLK
jgi:putative isomerase